MPLRHNALFATIIVGVVLLTATPLRTQPKTVSNGIGAVDNRCIFQLVGQDRDYVPVTRGTYHPGLQDCMPHCYARRKTRSIALRSTSEGDASKKKKFFVAFPT
jgi:hypothetical protein